MGVLDAILTSALGGLKRKPVLIVHLLVSIFLGILILWCGKLLINIVLDCLLCTPNFYFLLILALIGTSIFTGFYVNFWYNLREYMSANVSTMLDEVLSDYTSFINSIIDKSIYHFIRDYIKDIPIRKIFMLVMTYYLAWITGIYSIDLTLYIASKNRYTLFGYMLDHFYLSPVVFLAGLIIAQFIRPWQEVGEERNGLCSSSTSTNIQYLRRFLERFTSFRGLESVWRLSKTAWGRILINFTENVLALPSPIDFRGLFIIEVFQVPYLKSEGSQDMPADVIEIMMKKNTTEDYRLEPFRRECEKPVKTKVPLLRKACWYKVYRRRDNAWVRVGYAMLLVIADQATEKAFIKEYFNECIVFLKRRINRSNKPYCYNVIRELAKIYFEKRDIAIILLLGSEELLGLKLLLN